MQCLNDFDLNTEFNESIPRESKFDITIFLSHIHAKFILLKHPFELNTYWFSIYQHFAVSKI